MPQSPNAWLNAKDLESMITGQCVMVSATFKLPHYETIPIPRHLLEKYTPMFKPQLQVDDTADSLKLERVLDLSMNIWWAENRPEIIDDFPAMQAEWDMLKIFFMWMLSGNIVRRPSLPLRDLSWGLVCHDEFIADINSWLLTDWGLTQMAPAA